MNRADALLYIREERFRNREECFLCHQMIVQDSTDRTWCYEDDLDFKGPDGIGSSDLINSFPTQFGWCCSDRCWGEHHEEDELGNLIPMFGGAA